MDAGSRRARAEQRQPQPQPQRGPARRGPAAAGRHLQASVSILLSAASGGSAGPRPLPAEATPPSSWPRPLSVRARPHPLASRFPAPPLRGALPGLLSDALEFWLNISAKRP